MHSMDPCWLGCGTFEIDNIILDRLYVFHGY